MTVLALPVTVRALRAEITARFVEAGVASPNAEARDLIAAVVDQPRFWPVEHGDDQLSEDVVAAIRAATERRARGMPFAYAVGKAAFRYLTLVVDQRVLIPRQETEYLVDLVLDSTGKRGVVADICTGSGCIALALATEGQYERVIATEVSQESKAVAQMNADKLSVPRPRRPADIRRGDLLAPLTPNDCITAIVSNPPYIAPDEMADLPPSVRDWEPHRALVSDNDGLAHTFRIVDDAPRVLQPGGLLALEVDSRRAERVRDHVSEHGAYRDVMLHKDFCERDRYVLARLR
ncbi:MAG TPA: peptide chain release factor N(5)-glutamine methyltransferase [Gemmatimonadaceae bacterium]|jgi:release factor glutamine methyltransferase|nr:peptide chain release factor N(5)-glutamine methyltransferase [Gemmatimonadaceae bacterium]